ncbi:hypothetical protein RDABS01_035413 [Bienertia sinuspersici]
MYYKDLLGTEATKRMNVSTEIVHVGRVIDDEQAIQLLSPVTLYEIKKIVFTILGTKASGLDGYNSTFLKNSWDIVGDGICRVVMDFMDNGKLLREVNCTNLVLIAKVDSPSSVMDFRPIACCNTIYKSVSKLLCNYLRKVLLDIISPNQSCFIQEGELFIIFA